MARTTKPQGSTGGAIVAAEVVADMSAEDFNADTDASSVTVTAAKEGSLGTAIYNVLVAARDGLTRAGVKPPKGLTLRSRKGEIETLEDGTVSTVVAYFYGDPTDHTDAAHVGK